MPKRYLYLLTDLTNVALKRFGLITDSFPLDSISVTT